MIGFLQGFYEDDVLAEMNEADVIRQASGKALEIAMLGLKDEAISIWTLLKSSPHFSEKTISSAMEFFFAESGTDRPVGMQRLQEGKLQELEQKVYDGLPHLPEEVKSSNDKKDSYDQLSNFVKSLSTEYGANATTGYTVRALPRQIVSD
jgi:hypothetical protein